MFLRFLGIGIVTAVWFEYVDSFFVGLGLPNFLAVALTLILFWEIVVRFLLLLSIPSFVPKTADYEAVTNFKVDVVKFNEYCNEVKEIGFEELTEYTFPGFKGMVRLFRYPQHDCYGEVAMMDGKVIFCSFVSGFTGNQMLSVSSYKVFAIARVIQQVFYPLPDTVYKVFQEEPKSLFESFLFWQSKVKEKLATQPIAIANEEMYFSWIKRIRAKQRQRLMRQSVTVLIFRLLLYPFRKSED